MITATIRLAAQTVGPNLNLTKASGNQFEAAAAINPMNKNAIFVASRNETGGMYTARSTDGGVTWTTALIGLSTVPSPGDIPRAMGNPSVAWDSFGNLFMAYQVQNSPLSGSMPVLTMSTDGGATFYSPNGSGAAMLLSPSYRLGDQPTVVVGPGSGGFPGSVWVSLWSYAGIWAVGAGVSGLGTVSTFTGGPIASQPASVDYGDIAIGPNGEVMVTYGPSSGTSGAISINVDRDGLGPNPFEPYITVTAVNVGGATAIPAQPNWTIDPEAGLAWDRSSGAHRGRVHLVYTDAPGVGSTDTNIFTRYSDDLGTTWSAAVRVNDDAGANSQFLPRISLDQTTGMVAVNWYDARNSALNDTAQFYGAFSTDNGATFGANFAISAGTSNQANSTATGRKLDYGSYTGAAFDGGKLVPVWADNSNSTADNPNGATQFDVYTAIVHAPAMTVPCSATNATITSVNKFWLDVVIRAGDPVTHVVYTPAAAGTTFVGVTGFAVGELADYVGTLDAMNMCHASSMTVKPAPAPITIAPAALPNATIGVAYSAAITVSGGLAPTTITSVTGFPPGLVWSGSAVTGVPTALGTFALAVTATDARGLAQTSSVSLAVVDAPITFAPSLPAGQVKAAYSATISAAGGYGAFTYTASGLPAGLALSGSTISGTPAAAGTFAVTLTATDSVGTAKTAAVSLPINPAPSYTIPDSGSGRITSFGDHYIMVGTKKIVWDASTKFKINGATQIAVGMKAQWQGKRDANTGVVLANQLEIN
ncbi:MAG: hypothetical protein U0Q16_08335 [Bryobacteraceae bacterium]